MHSPRFLSTHSVLFHVVSCFQIPGRDNLASWFGFYSVYKVFNHLVVPMIFGRFDISVAYEKTVIKKLETKPASDFAIMSTFEDNFQTVESVQLFFWIG